MKRKSIYLLLCIILVFSLVTACGDKQATTPSGSSDNTDSQEVYTIDFAIHTSSGTNENKTLERFKELVEERSEGRIKINLYPDAVLGTELENLEQVKINEVQMSIFGDNLTGQLAPEFDPTIVPFIYKSVDDVYAVWEGEIGDLIKEAVETRGNQYVVALQKRGARNLTASKPINTPEDLKGLKIRVPEITSWLTVWGSLGAIPTPIAWSETYSALQTGVADGQENPIENIYVNKIYEVNEYIMMTEHLYNVFHWTINKDFYDSLPADLQNIIMETAKEVTVWGDEQLDDHEREIIEELEKAGVKFIEVDREAFIEAAASGIEEVSKTWDPRVQELVEEYLNK